MKQTSRFSMVVATIAVLWMFVVIFNYYIVHKPFGIENAIAILTVLGDIFTAGALVILSSALGRRLTRSFVFGSPLEAVVFQTGLGLGLVSFATLGLGLAGLLHPVLFWVLLLALLFLMRVDLLSLWRDLHALAFPITEQFDRILAIFVALSLVVAFLFALTPPTAWDAQTYHLVEAKQALTRGHIAAPPNILYFSFPSLVEMLFLAGMVLKGDIASQLIHFAFLLLTLGALYALALRFFNPRIAWLSCAILVAVPSLLTVATYAYVDLALVFYALASLYAALVGRERGEARWFALAGAFAGLAMGVKYTAVIVPIALVAVLLLSPRSRRPRLLISFLSFAILFAAPWYLRNLVFTGNPVYPFLFGGAYWDSFRAYWFSRFGTGMLGAPLQLLTVPWDATVVGREGALGFEATIGPILLALLPLLLLTGFSRGESEGGLREPLIFALVLYLFWLAGLAGSSLLWQTRLLFPAFPVLALGAAVACDRLKAFDMPQFSIRRFARLVIVLVLGFTAFQYVVSFAGSDTLMYLSGAETRDAFLARNLGEYQTVVKYVNDRLPANSNILFLWEPRSYYVQRQVQPDVILDALVHLRWQYHDPDAIAAALQNAGYTHLLLSRAGLDYQLQTSYDPISAEDVNVLEALVSRHFRQVYGQKPLQIVMRNDKPAVLDAESDPYALYEIVAPGAY
jgi:4-amino-4-deoxy-L-arabinose transferase-like glycosyltransferase